jgi:hypothetical protein
MATNGKPPSDLPPTIMSRSSVTQSVLRVDGGEDGFMSCFRIRNEPNYGDIRFQATSGGLEGNRP